MAYLALYRMFRPSTFEEVVRQEHIVRILKNQIADDKVGHAYLFCGPRGTGKTTLAKIFARAINCENPQNSSPCGKCPACLALQSGSNLDVSEIDAASNNGVDEMRDLREKVQYPPVAGKYKVYIIDEVHMLTQSAFNAVLKTLEEPPRHAVFILATTEPQKIPATILSRCMRFDFKLLPQSDLEELIGGVFDKIGKEYDKSAVSAIARAGAGSARDSLSIADMCASYSRGKLTYEDVNEVLGSAEWAKVADICGAILQENAGEALALTEDVLSSGKGVGVLLKDLLSFLNNCTIAKVCKSARSIINLPDETYNKISQTASLADGHKLLRVTEIFAKAENDMRYAVNGRMVLETAVFKASTPEADYNIDALIGRLNALERRISEGVAVKPVQNTERPPVYEEPVIIKRAEPKAESKPKAKPILEEATGENPFKVNETAVQSSISAGVAQNSGATAGNSKVFASFIKMLRTTHKNAVLFTLCMDLDHVFEGEKLILLTDSEVVLKSLKRPDNAKFIADVLLELSVSDYEVRFKPKGESGYDKALRELKTNFDGVDIEEK